MDIGVLGTGRIARRLVAALAESPDGHSIRITRRNAEISAELVARYPARVGRSDDMQAILDASRAVFVCLPGEVALDTLRGLTFRAEQTVISTMMGVRRADLAAAVAPARDVCVTIPLPFVEQGHCPLPVHPDSAVLRHLLGGTNPVIPVADEARLSAFWAVAGSMASVVGELAAIRDWLATRLDDPRAAERYVLALFGGYLHTRPQDGDDRLGEALADLGTPGGLNTDMLDAVRATGHYDRVSEELDRLHARVRNDEGPGGA